jgi:flagellar protein FlaG
MSIPIVASGVTVQAAPARDLFQQRSAPRETPAGGGPSGEPQRAADLGAAAADMEQVSLAFNRRLKFVVDHQSHEVTVKVIDPETDKVIRILPPEELQRLHGKIRETIGFLFDQRV